MTTPEEEFLAKLYGGTTLEMRTQTFYNITYAAPISSGRPATEIGLVESPELADKLRELSSRYIVQDVIYVVFTDPADPEPRTPMYLLAKRLGEPVLEVPTLDTELASELGTAGVDGIQNVLKVLTPNGGSSLPEASSS